MTVENIVKVPIAAIEWSDNVRSERSPDRIDEIAASLKQHGQLVPIRVRREGEKFYGIDGCGRSQAAEKLGWTELVAQVEEKGMSKSEVIIQQSVLNLQRDDLSIADKGRCIEMLMVLNGCTLKEVAATLGLSVATLSRWLNGHRLPDCLRDRVERGDIGLTTALEIAKNYKRDEMEDAAQAAASGKLTRDSLVGRRKRKKAADTSVTRSGSRFMAALDGGRAVSVTGVDGDLDEVIQILEELLGRARRARTKGHSASTFSKTLRDEAKIPGAQLKGGGE